MPSRVYIAGYRIHHGLAGLVLAGVGAALVAHDWRDRPWPIRDREKGPRDECGRDGRARAGW